MSTASAGGWAGREEDRRPDLQGGTATDRPGSSIAQHAI